MALPTGSTTELPTSTLPPTDEADAVLFDAVIVRYESDDDRCTLVPCNGTTTEKLNAWLTADLEAVVDLDDAR